VTLATLLKSTGLPHSTVIHIDKTHVHLLCDCGSTYRLNKDNKAGPVENYRCPDCKRLGRLQDHVGERHIFKRIRSDARIGGREFALELLWFVEKCHEPCHYCGRTDTNSTTVPSKTNVPLIKDFRYNGLDRLDNSIGYVPSNCVPCCFVCNRAKQSMPYSDFVRWINDMVEYRSNH
jgi:hypothetical protein